MIRCYKEEVMETAEILIDYETMRNISEALADINNKNKSISFECLKKELNF